jgi:ABC-type dipeptide/oligopeptide/nickel transport system permease subunit
MRRFAVCLLLIILGLCVLAPLVAPDDPLHAVTRGELQPPSLRHPLGTDLLGRDVWSRVLYGGRATLLAAVTALSLALVFGTVLGLIAGLGGQAIDGTITMITNVLLAFPVLLFALLIILIIGTGIFQVAVAVGLAGVPPVIVVTRSAVRNALGQPYIEAARSLGATRLQIGWRHVLPNIAPTLRAFGVVILSWALMNAATLNFLGLGGETAQPEWGSMLAQARITFARAPWTVIAPGLAIMITVCAVNLL